MWWHMPVVPATQEAEAGELLEPGRRKLQWAEITPLHSSLGETPTQKKKKEKEKRFNWLSVLQAVQEEHSSICFWGGLRRLPVPAEGKGAVGMLHSKSRSNRESGEKVSHTFK